MTVKDVIKVIKNARRLTIGFGDRAIAIDQDDALMIDVYGDYVVDAIRIDEARNCEIDVAMRPVKGGSKCVMLSELCNVIAAREVVVFDARENHGIHSYGKDPLEEDSPIRKACLEFGERIVESVIATGLMEISITII